MLNASAIYVRNDENTISGNLLSFSQDRLGNAIGQFCGWLSGLVVYSVGGLEYFALVIICFCSVVLFIAANMLVFERVSFADDVFIVDTHNLYNDEQMVLQQVQLDSGRWQKKCERVAREYGLSQRQTDVFMLLARGRSARYIQDKLVLSNHTIKSHTYGIYRKLNIHSKQELIDLLESR
jgi:DNA-binding CsgD family transcriptional regulator